MKNMDTPDWTLVSGGHEVKQDCPLRTRRRLAGLHQIQTTAGSASTTSERMSLLLDTLEDEDANEYTLLHHITVMLEERKALWCIPFINSVLSVDLAQISASFSVPHVLLCRLLLPNSGVALGVW